MATNQSPTLKQVESWALDCALTAHALNVPEDQITNFFLRQYIPQPKQLEFHAASRLADAETGPDQVGFGGARGPGKSHAIFAQIALDDCQRCPGLKVLYIRKVAKNAREQFEDLRRAVLRGVNHEYNRSIGLISFANGSRIVIGHFKNESDVDQYLGLEYDVIAIEEATTLSLSKYKTLRDSNRTSKPNWRPRIYASTNPGNIGHSWFKERFITPARRNVEADTRFVFATVDDNRFIDSGYKKKLEDNTGWKLRAYRFGDWDIAAGQFFSTWRHDVHVLPKAFPLPAHWPVWASLDYGFNHPTVAYLLTENDGVVYIVGEYWARRQLVPQNADGIKAMLAKHGVELKRLRSFEAGHDCFSQKGDSDGKTIADQYQEQGIRLTPANIDRISGAARFLELLGDKEHGIEARLKIFPACEKLIECVPILQHDPNRPEDVLKVDIDDDGMGGDDAYDAARYGLAAKFRKPAKAVPFRT